MHVNRGLVFWGLALVAAGTVALLIQSGAIGDEGARTAWRWWPIALIAAGVAIIAARTPFALATTVVAALMIGGLAGTLVAGWSDGIAVGCAGEPTERSASTGDFTGSAAEVELRLSCGELTVDTSPGAGWSATARHDVGHEPRLDASGDSLRMAAEGDGFIGFGRTRQEWSVTLPTDVGLELTVDANAATSRLDLADANLSLLALDTNAGDLRIGLEGASVAELSLEMNAGSVAITADESTELVGDVGMNAGSLELCVPEGAPVEVVLDDPNVTFSHNLDDRGFTASGDTWRAGDGTPAVRLEVDGNAANLTVNPSGGCS